MSVSLEDGTIYARSEAKVIGVNDQTAHRVSLAGRKKGAMQRECLSSEFGGEHPEWRVCIACLAPLRRKKLKRNRAALPVAIELSAGVC